MKFFNFSINAIEAANAETQRLLGELRIETRTKALGISGRGLSRSTVVQTSSEPQLFGVRLPLDERKHQAEQQPHCVPSHLRP
jgi:hypothetical protein